MSYKTFSPGAAWLATAATIGLTFGLWSSATAQERFDHKVRNLFFAGFTGDKESLEKGMKIAADTIKENPKHAEALVWHGAGLFFQSGEAFQKQDMANGMKLSTQGLKEMDEAVALEPNNIGVRVPRGSALIAASRFWPQGMQRPLIERGLADFEKTMGIQAPFFETIGTHPRGELLMGLADAYSRLDQKEKATAHYERIVKELPGSVYERNAKEWLETGKLSPQKAGCLGCHTGK